MEKKEKIFKEASYEAQMEQARIIFSEPYEIEVGGKILKIRPLTSSSQVKISEHAIRQTVPEDDDANKPNLIALTRKNLKHQCKAVALALLNDNRGYGTFGLIKRFFLFGIKWRLIYNSWDNSQINQAFFGIVEKYGLEFFFLNLKLLSEMNSMKKKKTKEEVQSSQAEQKSE